MNRSTWLLCLLLSIALSGAACDDNSNGTTVTEDSAEDDTAEADATGEDATQEEDAVIDATTVEDATAEETSEDMAEDVPEDEEVAGVTIKTEGCEAVFSSICSAIGECPVTDPLVAIAVQGCPAGVAGLGDQIDTLCTNYLNDNVDKGRPLATWLNDASATEVEDCVNQQQCSETFVKDITDAGGKLFSGDATAMDALLQAALAGCFPENP